MKAQPKIIFHQPSLKYDVLRLLFTSHKLATGQYQYHNWLIAPTLPAQAGLPASSPSNLIIFPNLPYTSIPHFWEQVTRDVTPTTPSTAPDALIQSLVKTSRSVAKTPPLERGAGHHSLQTAWHDIKDQFWPTFFSIFPTYQNKLKTIHVYPTLYGTTKSFSLINNTTTTLHIYLRVDQDINSLIDGIVSGTIRGQLQRNQRLTWTETEAVKDTFLLTTPLANFAPDYHSTLHAIRSPENKQARQNSLSYLKHLGLDSANKWIIQNNTIQYHGQTLTNLTKQDRIILTTLINTPDHALTQHELATSLYPNPERFSLWGLAKAIQRLRAKLKKNGLPTHLIQVNRGHGYSLFSAPTITKPDDLIF